MPGIEIAGGILILLAVAGSGMDAAGARLQGDVLAQDDHALAVDEGVLVLEPLERLPLEGGQDALRVHRPLASAAGGRLVRRRGVLGWRAVGVAGLDRLQELRHRQLRQRGGGGAQEARGNRKIRSGKPPRWAGIHHP